MGSLKFPQNSWLKSSLSQTVFWWQSSVYTTTWKDREREREGVFVFVSSFVHHIYASVFDPKRFDEAFEELELGVSRPLVFLLAGS